MPDRPRVSVLTTAFNAERFVGEAIASVLVQEIDLEHVVVDDGSQDRTAEIVRGVKDDRVRLIEPGRVGRGRALNVGLRACRSEFVAILDADDVSHPRRLVTEVSVLEEAPEAAIVGSGQLLVTPGELPVWPRIAGTARVVNQALPYYNPLSHSSVLLRRSILEVIGRYDESRRALFDWDLYVRVAATGSTLLKLDIPLVAKRIHSDQFFEGYHEVRYAFECLKLQWRSLALLGRSHVLSFSFLPLLAYRLLPRSARLKVRRLVPLVRHGLLGGN